jgi:dienelactone hydrolase
MLPSASSPDASVEVCSRKAGYLTVAPDIYSNDRGYAAHEPEVIESAAHLRLGREAAEIEAVLQTYEPSLRQRILAAYEWVLARPTTTYIDVVAGCFEHVRARAGVKAIGSIGYCMGGRLTAELAATGVDLSAAVIFYGAGPNPEAIPNVRCPVQGHYAVTDRGITGKVYDFALAMHAAGKTFNYSLQRRSRLRRAGGESLQFRSGAYRRDAVERVSREAPRAHESLIASSNSSLSRGCAASNAFLRWAID